MIATQPRTKRRSAIGFDKINRRTHLYAGLFFLPWFLFYGVSSAVFNHPAWFGSGPIQMSVLFDKPYNAPTMAPGGDLRPFAEKALEENGLAGQFAVRRENGNILIFQDRFLSTTQVVYNAAARRLTARRGFVNGRVLLTRVHTRGGYQIDDFARICWAVLVDLVQIAILIWIASGVFMWWNLRRFRGWGLLALGAGVALFGAFLIGL